MVSLTHGTTLGGCHRLYLHVHGILPVRETDWINAVCVPSRPHIDPQSIRGAAALLRPLRGFGSPCPDEPHGNGVIDDMLQLPHSAATVVDSDAISSILRGPTGCLSARHWKLPKISDVPQDAASSLRASTFALLYLCFLLLSLDISMPVLLPPSATVAL